MFKPFNLILLLLIIVFAGTSGFFFWKYRTEMKKNPQHEVESLVQEVSGLMQLPEGNPTVATITDKTKLQDQTFFQNAENGDKVLLYIEKQKAILYRPSTKKIIDVVPIRNSNTNGASPSAPSPTPQGSSQAPSSSNVAGATANAKTVTLLNGTSIPGMTLSAEKKISDMGDSIVVSEKKNAQVDTYQQSFVVDLSGSSGKETQQIAQALSAKVESTLPSDENRPNSDIVVVLGSDFKQ